MTAPPPLAGRTVVVTRSLEQAGRLTELLEAAGAEVIGVPTIAIADPADGGAALADAARRLADYDWVVVTSPNGAERLAAVLPGPWPRQGPRLAVVGPGTRGAADDLGLPVSLVPERFVAEGLLDAFAVGRGRVLVAQAARARPVLVDGLRAKGYVVDAVVAYETRPAVVERDVLNRVTQADAITFTSASTVENFLGSAGRGVLPPVVVTMGPVASAAASARGVAVTAEADPHTLDGLVDAVARALS